MRLFITLMLMISTVLAQGMGHGISKSTWGSSDPRACAAWFKKYLINAAEAQSTCQDGKCECATQGRYQLSDSDDPEAGLSFGVHTINCTYHPYGEHGLLDIENMIHASWGDFTGFNPFMDYNVGLWTYAMSDFIKKFDTDTILYTALKWTSDDDQEYYSLIVNPCGFAVIEFIASKVDEADESKFTKVDHMRMSFKNTNNMPSSDTGSLTPLKISRATARMEDIKKWYNSDINAKMVANHKGDDGSETAVFMFHNATVQLHFVQGRKADHAMIQSKQEADDEFTPKKWEEYMHSVHKATWNADSDGTCGFDQWFDNHYAYDGHVALDIYVANAKKLGYQYHWWALPQGRYQVYVVDPTGFSVQFDGQATTMPSNCPTYSAACKSNDGCAGQGICPAKEFFFLQ